jgi:hypothetical protein
MARKTVAKKNAPSEQAKPIADVLEFLSPILKEEEANKASAYCTFADGRVTAFDGILAGGINFPFDIRCAPQVRTLLLALRKCKGEMAIAMTENGHLAISAGKFNAMVPCMDAAALPAVWPDNPQYPLTDTLYDYFEKLLPILSDGDSKEWLQTAICFKDKSMVATDKHILAEVWHGFSGVTHGETYYPLPTLILPRRLLVAMLKIRKPLYGFGVGDKGTVTFWFTDNSWIRTQQYVETYPDTDRIFNQSLFTMRGPVPEINLALEAVEPFSDDGSVWFGDGSLRASLDTGKAAYRLDGLPPNFRFQGKYLRYALSVAADQMAFEADKGLFYGGTAANPIRVLVCGMATGVKGPDKPPPAVDPEPITPQPLTPEMFSSSAVQEEYSEIENWEE